MSAAFDVAEIERRYAFLDDCPEQFVAQLVTLPVGRLSERVAGLNAWREALLQGRLPPVTRWPPPEIAGPARRALQALGIAPYCKAQPGLADAVLTDVLASFGREDAAFKADVHERLRALERLERTALAKKEKGRRLSPLAERLDDAVIARLRARAERETAQRTPTSDARLVAAWEETARAWAAVAEVFGDLGEMLGRGWDLSQGVLRHVGWQDLVRLRKLIEELPQLREIVRSLGRLHASETTTPIADTLFVPVRRLEEERRDVWTPGVPAEMRGIERSGEIARMLPLEAVNLGHPKLRMLWHARRAERALLTYRVEGIEVERTLVERESTAEVESTAPRRERGPILVVLDTSGSMHGLPERVAKALVLEALRVAHAERRACLLFAYSGPGQIAEHRLELSAQGIGGLLAFLGVSFGGGSDEIGVLTKVVQQLEEQQWRKADVIFVSDGEWPASEAAIALVQRAREAGTRFHGVQIGNRGTTGLHALCDPVHVFQDWGAVGER